LDPEPARALLEAMRDISKTGFSSRFCRAQAESQVAEDADSATPTMNARRPVAVLRSTRFKSSLFPPRIDAERVPLRLEPGANVALREQISERHIRRLQTSGMEVLAEGRVAIVLDCTAKNANNVPVAILDPGLPSKKCFLALYVERLLRLHFLSCGESLDHSLLLVLTESLGRRHVERCLERNERFGWNRKSIYVVEVPDLPVCDSEGKMQLGSRETLLLRPAGSACVLELLQKNFARELQARQCSHLFLCCVDNLLGRPLDPWLMGHALVTGAGWTLKVTNCIDLETQRGVLATKEDGGRHAPRALPTILDCAEVRLVKDVVRESFQTQFRFAESGQHVVSIELLPALAEFASTKGKLRFDNETVFEKGHTVSRKCCRLELDWCHCLQAVGKCAAMSVERENAFPTVTPTGDWDFVSAAQRMSQEHSRWTRARFSTDDAVHNSLAEGFCEISPLVCYAGLDENRDWF